LTGNSTAIDDAAGEATVRDVDADGVRITGSRGKGRNRATIDDAAERRVTEDTNADAVSLRTI